MKIEYFAEGSFDCPLVLLFGPTTADICVLRDVINELSQDRINRLAIHECRDFMAWMVVACLLHAALLTLD